MDNHVSGKEPRPSMIKRLKSELWKFDADELLSMTKGNGTKIPSSEIKPMKFAELLVKYPCRFCCALFWFILFIQIIVLADKGPDFMLEYDNSKRAISDYDATATANWDAVMLARDDLTEENIEKIPVKTQIGDEHVNFYKAKGDSLLLTPDNLRKMAHMEYTFWDQSRESDTSSVDTTTYYSFCKTVESSDSFPDCAVEDTVEGEVIMWLLDLGRHATSDEEWQERIDEAVHTMFNNEYYWQYFNEDFGNQSGLATEVVPPTLLRTVYHIAFPYPDIDPTTSTYYSLQDESEKQYEAFYDWTYKGVYEKLSADWFKIKDFSTSTMDAYYYDTGVLTELALQVDQLGLMFTVFAVMFVWTMMAVHMGSVFLSVFAMGQIMLSFPLAIATYYYICQVPFWSVLNSLILYVVLGIGADDVFIFYDQWMQAETLMEDPTDLVARLSRTYRRAGKAMLVTTFTTCITFLAAMSSALPTVKAFGVFSALVIFYDYVLAMTLFPIGVVLAWKFPMLRFCGCCGGEKACCKCCKPKDNSEGYRFWERCCGTKWSAWVFNCRAVIVPVFAVLFVVGIVGATQLELPEEEDQWYVDGFPIQEAMDTAANGFYSGVDLSSETPIWFVWGVNGADRSNVGYMDVTTKPNVKYDEHFDIMSPEGQQYVIDVCDELDNIRDFTKIDEPMVEPGSVSCFMRDYKIWTEKVLGETFPRFFNSDPAKQREAFIESLLEFTKADTNETDTIPEDYRTSQELGFVRGSDEFKFAMVTARTYAKPTNGLDANQKGQSDWNNWFDEMNAKAPSLDAEMGIWATDYETGYPWMDLQQALIGGAMTGILIALPLALITMLLFTANWILSLYAILVIVGVILTLILYIAMMGYPISTVEAVVLVVMIGFCVDYAVHMGHAYLENEHLTSRRKRTRMALTDMGVSIFFGAVTTFFSVLPMTFLPQMVYRRFGELIMVTVIFALLWSLCLFPPMLTLIGPEGEQGEMKFVHKILHKVVTCSCFRTKEVELKIQNDLVATKATSAASASESWTYTSRAQTTTARGVAVGV